jgi:hypothetical protein
MCFHVVKGADCLPARQHHLVPICRINQTTIINIIIITFYSPLGATQAIRLCSNNDDPSSLRACLQKGGPNVDN